MSELYAGTILLIDLSSQKISKEPTSSFSRQFLGGRGINGKLLYDRVPSRWMHWTPKAFSSLALVPLVAPRVPARAASMSWPSPL